jgi:RHS repeat-associated protein
MRKEVNKPATAYVDSVFAYNYDANDRITSETLDNGVNGAGVDQTTTYGWTQTQQTSKTVSVPSVSSVVQSMSYGLGGQLERVVTTTSNGSGTVTGRSRVDYRYNPQGIRTISVDWTDANLDGTFAAGERTGSVEYLIENANFTGYQQTILETVKNAAGQATKRTSYTFGVDEITQTVSQIDPSSQLITQSSTLTFAHDGKGSVRALFGAAAAIAQVFTYSAYGELLAIHNGSGTLQPLTSSLTSVLYNGEGLDARTGLYNMRARWYSASNARWERLDPFSGNATDPFSFNKYGFVHGDPVMGTDPTGKSGFFSFGTMGLLSLMTASAFVFAIYTNPGAWTSDSWGSWVFGPQRIRRFAAKHRSAILGAGTYHPQTYDALFRAYDDDYKRVVTRYCDLATTRLVWMLKETFSSSGNPGVRANGSSAIIQLRAGDLDSATNGGWPEADNIVLVLPYKYKDVTDAELNSIQWYDTADKKKIVFFYPGSTPLEPVGFLYEAIANQKLGDSELPGKTRIQTYPIDTFEWE